MFMFLRWTLKMIDSANTKTLEKSISKRVKTLREYPVIPQILLKSL